MPVSAEEQSLKFSI